MRAMTDREAGIARRTEDTLAMIAKVRVCLTDSAALADIGWKGVCLSAPIDRHGEEHFIRLAAEYLS